jgi:hypothetical protein
MYNDSYDTCAETYATLRVYCDNQHPNDLTKLFGINPTEIQVKGQSIELRKNKNHVRHGWFLSSEGQINSKDSRRHIDYILDKILPVKSKLDLLIIEGAKIDISCFWQSKGGHGGPTLSKQQLQKLVDLGVDLWFDNY